MNVNFNVSKHLNFCKSHIYAVNTKGGKDAVKEFDSIVCASEQLGIPKSSISAVLSGKNYVTSDYSFFYADDYSKDLSKEEIQRKLLTSVQLNLKNAYSQPIYAIDIQGNYQRFNSPKEAAEYFEVECGDLSKVLKKGAKNPVCKNHVFVKASNVESRNYQGVSILSVKALNQTRDMFLKAKSCPIVVISENKEFEVLESQKAVVEKYNIDPSRLSVVLKEWPKASKGHVFVKLDNVVMRNKAKELMFDDENNFILDQNKIHHCWLQGFYGRLLKPLR